MENIDNQNIKIEDFSFINQTNKFWLASNLMQMLEYKNWNDFKKIIDKAIIICESLNIPVYDNFIQEYDNEIENYKLSRFACYLIISNADIKKIQVAKAQTFFYEQNQEFQNILKQNYNKNSFKFEDTKKEAILFDNMKSFFYNKDAKIKINKNIKKTLIEEKIINHFSEIKIEQCKVLKNLEIKYLNKINIFAGINNSGKTTLLESVNLLANLNNINDFFEIQRKRGKFNNNLSAVWLDSVFKNEIIINGIFNEKKCSVKINKAQEEDENIDKSSYLNTINIASEFDNKKYKSKSRIYQEQNSETFFDSIKIICNSTFSSPFSLLNKEDIVHLHERNVELSMYSQIIEFLQKNIDNKIIDIDLIGDGELKRFLVTHKDFEIPVDLTQFGEGIQRIFYIALQFAISRNGILLIDEIENAIHFSLLEKFTYFIHQLSEKFNVQVFITSHSKECIEAFLNNDYKIENLSFYQLIENEGNISCKYASGVTYKKLLKTSKFIDLRGKLKDEGGKQ